VSAPPNMIIITAEAETPSLPRRKNLQGCTVAVKKARSRRTKRAGPPSWEMTLQKHKTPPPPNRRPPSFGRETKFSGVGSGRSRDGWAAAVSSTYSRGWLVSLLPQYVLDLHPLCSDNWQDDSTVSGENGLFGVFNRFGKSWRVHGVYCPFNVHYFLAAWPL